MTLLPQPLLQRPRRPALLLPRRRELLVPRALRIHERAQIVRLALGAEQVVPRGGRVALQVVVLPLQVGVAVEQEEGCTQVAVLRYRSCQTRG